jgi:cytoskeletal protein RodZ
MASPSQQPRIGKVVQHPRSAVAVPPPVEKRPAVTTRPPGPELSASPKGGRQTFGDIIRRARELRGIELRDVAEATKINLRYLEALERNDFTYIPGGIHARNFVRAYARQIGVDEAEMVNAFLYEQTQQQKKGPAEEPPVVVPLRTDDPTVRSLRSHYQVEAGSDDRRRRRARSVLVIVAIAVAAAAAGAGYWFVAKASRGQTAAPVTTPAPATPAR